MPATISTSATFVPVQEEVDHIYREHRKSLCALARAITRTPDAAEDAVQQAVTQLLSCKVEPGIDLLPYVFAAVRNAAVDQKRRNAVIHLVDRRLPASGSEKAADPRETMIEAELHDRIRRALDTLSRSDREVIVLHLYTGLTFQQIADAVYEPLWTITSRYRRALMKLKKGVEGQKIPRGRRKNSPNSPRMMHKKRSGFCVIDSQRTVDG